MAGIKDILEIEQMRETSEDWRKIHLFQEGSFYRAYEESAWLCYKHVSQFRVTHRHVKGIEQTIAFVGFPLMSLEKRTPEGAQVVNIAEKHVAIVLPEKDDDADVESLEREFEEWKSTQPLTEPKENVEKDKHTPRSSCNTFHHIDVGKTWGDCLDMEFLHYLTREIVLLDPTEGCRIKGRLSDWDCLPRDKSLFYSPHGCGLPIGNLTSQLFSNVYLGQLDDYMKRTLRCRHYGRYVDDFYVVSANREWLRGIIPKVRQFLKEELELTLHEGKVRICSVRQGVEFLGAYLKPHRRYVSSNTLNRMQRKLPSLTLETDTERLRSRCASFRGVLSHYRTCWLAAEPDFLSLNLFFPASFCLYFVK